MRWFCAKSESKCIFTSGFPYPNPVSDYVAQKINEKLYGILNYLVYL